MTRQYLTQNVYEAFQQRMHFIFTEFDNIFVSFSGGKDSGLLLNLTLVSKKKYYPSNPSGYFIRILKPNTPLQRNMWSEPSRDCPKIQWWNCTGSASHGGPDLLQQLSKCTGIRGMIPSKNSGSVPCRSIPM